MAYFVFVNRAPIPVTKFCLYIKFCQLVDSILIKDIRKGELSGELQNIFVGWVDVHKYSFIRLDLNVEKI